MKKNCRKWRKNVEKCMKTSKMGMEAAMTPSFLSPFRLARDEEVV
jgi:hypothetical protein